MMPLRGVDRDLESIGERARGSRIGQNTQHFQFPCGQDRAGVAGGGVPALGIRLDQERVGRMVDVEARPQLLRGVQ